MISFQIIVFFQNILRNVLMLSCSKFSDFFQCSYSLQNENAGTLLIFIHIQARFALRVDYFFADSPREQRTDFDLRSSTSPSAHLQSRQKASVHADYVTWRMRAKNRDREESNLSPMKPKRSLRQRRARRTTSHMSSGISSRENILSRIKPPLDSQQR